MKGSHDMSLIDISVPIEPGMIPYDGDADVEIAPHALMTRGAPADVSRLSPRDSRGAQPDPCRAGLSAASASGQAHRRGALSREPPAMRSVP